MPVKPIPEAYHAVTPYLVVRGVRKLIEFLKQAFDAKETEFVDMGNGHVHAEVRIGDSIVMMGEAEPAPASLYLYVNDVDATYKRALQAGAASRSEPTDHFYGDRSAGVTDPCGNTWWIATHKEDVPPEELRRHAAAQAR